MDYLTSRYCVGAVPHVSQRDPGHQIRMANKIIILAPTFDMDSATVASTSKLFSWGKVDMKDFKNLWKEYGQVKQHKGIIPLARYPVAPLFADPAVKIPSVGYKQ